MSSQRGNASRTRAQKHKNNSVFKNTMHDTSKRTQIINTIEAVGCCVRCKDIIDWKIKYKKYKQLTVAKKCTGCQEKQVKRAYYILCDACVTSSGCCGKCGKNKDLALGLGLSEAEEASKRSQLQQELHHLPERQRRTFFRLQESGKLSNLKDDKCAAEENNSDSAEETSSDGESNECLNEVTDDCSQTKPIDNAASLPASLAALTASD